MTLLVNYAIGENNLVWYHTFGGFNFDLNYNIDIIHFNILTIYTYIF